MNLELPGVFLQMPYSEEHLVIMGVLEKKREASVVAVRAVPCALAVASPEARAFTSSRKARFADFAGEVSIQIAQKRLHFISFQPVHNGDQTLAKIHEYNFR